MLGFQKKTKQLQDNFENEVYKLQEELKLKQKQLQGTFKNEVSFASAKLKLKQKQLEDEYRCSKLIISRNEIVDIFQGVVPKYVAMYISSYHRHPIDEFIGEDKLKEKESNLSGWHNCGYHYTCYIIDDMKCI